MSECLKHNFVAFPHILSSQTCEYEAQKGDQIFSSSKFANNGRSCKMPWVLWEIHKILENGKKIEISKNFGKKLRLIKAFDESFQKISQIPYFPAFFLIFYSISFESFLR